MQVHFNPAIQVLLPVLVFGSLTAPPALAEEKAAHSCGVTSTKKVSLAFSDSPLDKVLLALAKEGSFSYVVSALSPKNAVVNAFFQEVPLGEAVDAIVASLGLRCEQRGSLVVIGIPGKGAFATEPGH